MTGSTTYTGTHLLDVARHKGHSVAWLARQMGYTRQHLYAVVNGERAITQPFVDAAIRVLGLPETALFFGPLHVSGTTNSHHTDGRAA